MKALLVEKFGGPKTLRVGDIPSRPLNKGEVRVAVHACGMNFADTLIIEGKYQEKPPFPFSPGMEIAGEVIEVAEGLKNPKVGARVIAVVGHGGYAEEVVVPAMMCIPMPDSMPYDIGAALPIAYGTSHVGLTHRARLKKDETLLVHGAAGGVGLTAVEIGALLGAKVIATASTAEKLAIAQEHGASILVETSSPDFTERLRAVVKETTGGKGVNVAYDPVGGECFDASLKTIAWEGRIVVIGFASGTTPQVPANLLLVKNCAVMGFYWGAYAMKDPMVIMQSFGQLMAWYNEGKIKPRISHRFKLEEWVDAMDAITSRKVTGKAVIQVRS